VALNTIEEKNDFLFDSNMRVVHVDLEAITRLLGLNTLRERDTHTHTHTQLIWVSLEISKLVCLFDVEIDCIIKGLVGMPELPIENAPSSVGQGNGNAQNVCMYVNYYRVR